MVLGFGLALGAAVALASAKLVTSYVPGAHTLDPAMLALTALVLASIGGLAAIVPSRKALAVQAIDALRQE
jgi:ABC-type antimicrobial peptide transport system permease subunit